MLDISKLKNGVLEKIEVNEEFTFTDEDIKHTSIKGLKDVKAVGKVTRLSDSVYNVQLLITGIMKLECARSLEEVDYPINISIDQNYSEEPLEDEKCVIFQNMLDISSIVWENIVLEVPLRTIKEDAEYLKSGEGWSIKSEEEMANTPLSELKSMLDMEGKEWN